MVVVAVVFVAVAAVIVAAFMPVFFLLFFFVTVPVPVRVCAFFGFSRFVVVPVALVVPVPFVIVVFGADLAVPVAMRVSVAVRRCHLFLRSDRFLQRAHGLGLGNGLTQRLEQACRIARKLQWIRHPSDETTR
eukprot:CAMPEP_0197422156 /NCGR_PEP_ID=MMETSP1170-20131217/14338_1 /TAXON_ID=54406 /ORGANISM="Sarcinochrysis sp, Strain CCMP770" /LENGTH=132 /DNA_ID=CAMNT_0042949471 /DNA_START=315 /DNA_END=713 /DNA_ORIENTATION=-